MTRVTRFELLVPECRGCTMPDHATGRCTVFVDPGYQWRNYDPQTKENPCWGRCGSIEEMIRRLEGMAKHNALHGNSKSLLVNLRRDIEDWRETQEITAGLDIAWTPEGGANET